MIAPITVDELDIYRIQASRDADADEKWVYETMQVIRAMLVAIDKDALVPVKNGGIEFDSAFTVGPSKDRCRIVFKRTEGKKTYKWKYGRLDIEQPMLRKRLVALLAEYTEYGKDHE